jgi:hypothetical protein
MLTKDAGLVHLENGKAARVYTKQDGLPKFPLFFMTGSRLGLIAKDADGSLWLVDLPSMQKELLLKKPPFRRRSNGGRFHQPTRTAKAISGSARGATVYFEPENRFITAFSQADGIADKNVYPIYEDRAGTVWVGTTGGLFKRENETLALVESAENFQVNAIGEDALGRILIGNFGALYVQENNQFVPFEPEKIPPERLHLCDSRRP